MLAIKRQKAMIERSSCVPLAEREIIWWKIS